MQAALPRLKRAGSAVLGLLLPHRCLACGTSVESAGALCPDCWSGVTFIAPPICDCCGYPFPYDAGEGALCAACSARHPVYGRARAVFAYDEASRGPVLAFKHADRTDAAPAFGAWLKRAGSALLAEAGLVVPVPLHRTRLLARRYNQAAELARALAAASGVAAAPDLLVRTRRTPSQGGLSATGRRRNVQGAFAIRPGMEGAARGARIVLVDDVLTTGATAEACARTLLRAGAAAVDVLTLARVVRPNNS
jgi:ComF family protein